MPVRSVVDVMNQLLTDWTSPREPTDVREANLEIEMLVRCSADKCKGPLVLGDDIPPHLKEFWSVFSSARLFEDVNYGQSGLILFDYETSNRRTREFNRERPGDAARGDRVIGGFIGDQDLLLIRCNPRESDFGSILVAIRDGWRNEWHSAASSLSSFLEEYASSEGQKYWTPQFRGRRKSSE